MTRALVIVGAGGHAAVLADALLRSGRQVLAFTDRDASRHGTSVCGIAVAGGDEVLVRWSPDEVALVNGIGGIGEPGEPLRERVQRKLEARGWRFAGVRHPAATVSEFAHLADDVQVLAQAVVQPGAHVGHGCIVNTGAIVEHDCRVGDFSHIAPRAVLCGNVEVAAAVHVGAGAVVRQGIRLGPRTRIGAGAVVISDYAGDGTLVGVPARPGNSRR